MNCALGYGLPELVNRYPRSTQIFSFLDYLLRHFFLEMENMDGENKSFDWIFDKNMTQEFKKKSLIRVVESGRLE